MTPMTWFRSSLVALFSISAATSAMAGGTETYTVVFDATWSMGSHPTDFPPNPHFSGLVGGSHNGSVSFWSPGELATEGIRRMAEQGSKSTLMAEVQDAVDAGTADVVLCGPSIATSPDAVSMTIEVDPAFSKVTLVSMIAPSPDWFIGTDGVDLRDGSGEWIDQVIVDLRAWDAGTDSGVSYTSGNDPSDPRDVITDITNVYPFFGETLGTLRFTRQAVSVDTPTDVSAFALSPARPNPSTAGSAVTLTLDVASSLEATIFDVNGRLVRSLANGPFAAGEHRVVWDGRTAANALAPAGVYFFRLATRDAVRTSRVTLTR